MSQQELVEAYREGKIGQLTFFRRLVKSGLSVGAALALVLSVPAKAQANDVVIGPPSAGPGNAVNALNNASNTILGVAAELGEKGKLPRQAVDNVTLNLGNAAVQLNNVALNLPGNTGDVSTTSGQNP